MREESAGKALARLEKDVYATEGAWDLSKVRSSWLSSAGELTLSTQATITPVLAVGPK